MKIYGKNVLYEALNANRLIRKVYMTERVLQEDLEFQKKVKEKNISIKCLDKNDMDHLFQGLHQGYGAEVEDYKTYTLEEVIHPNKKQLFLMLDQIQDPHNFGAMLRSADAFGVDAIIIPKNRSVGITSTVVKVSTGAIEYVPIVVVQNLNYCIDTLKKHNFWVIGTDASAEKNIYDVVFDTSLVLVIGSEGYGISRLTLEKCDYLVKIPMVGHVNSLNASVSAGICLSALKQQQ